MKRHHALETLGYDHAHRFVGFADIAGAWLVASTVLGAMYAAC